MSNHTYPFYVRWDAENNCYLAQPFGLPKHHQHMTHGDTLGEVYAMCSDLALFILDDLTELEVLTWRNLFKGVKINPAMNIALITPRMYCSWHKVYDNNCKHLSHEYYDINEEILDTIDCACDKCLEVGNLLDEADLFKYDYLYWPKSD